MPLHAPNGGEPKGPAADFYIGVLRHLVAEEIPFLVGGGYAVEIYTDIRRRTKDIDLFLKPEDSDWAVQSLTEAGYDAELVYDHWLAKVREGDELIDMIFGSANGGGRVDQAWFDHAVETRILGLPMKLCPPEEMIWQKAFVMARDRFDGADVMHLLRACGERLDWQRLGARFGADWRVLLAHLVLFGYAYPGHRSLIPTWVIEGLQERLGREWDRAPDEEAKLCRGTMLCFEDFRVAVERWGYLDARPAPLGRG